MGHIRICKFLFNKYSVRMNKADTSVTAAPKAMLRWNLWMSRQGGHFRSIVECLTTFANH